MSDFDRNLSYRPAIPKLDYRELPFQLVDKWAERWPEKPSFVFRASEESREWVSFGDLKRATERLAVWFRRLGLCKGDRVGILSVNRLSYVLTDLGVNRIGGVSVRLYVTMDSAQDLTRTLSATQCRFLVTQNESMTSIRTLVPDLDHHNQQESLNLNTLPYLERIIYFPGHDSSPGALEFPDFMRLQPTDQELEDLYKVQKTHSMEDDCTIYSTSGSTGLPKCIVYSNDSFLRLMSGILRRIGVSHDDVYFTDRPMAHIGGITSPCLVFGITQVIANPWKTVKTSGQQYLSKVFVEEKVTIPLAFPYFLYDLVQQGGDFSEMKQCLRTVIFGGQLANYEIIKTLKEKLGVSLINAYGMTEIGEIACCFPTDPFEVVARGPSQVLETEVKVTDEQGRILPVGQDGHISVRVTRKWRYLDKNKMAATHDGDGFFRTGDMGRMDAEGRLEVLSRADDVISVGTAKTYPGPVEQKLCEHPSVDKCQVFGVPDPRLGHVIGAVVMPKKGHNITTDDVINFMNQSVNENDLMTGCNMAPKHVWIEENFPLTNSGKVDKKTLMAKCLKSLAAD